MAHDYVWDCGYAAVAIDGPGHGDRITPEQAEAIKKDSNARWKALRQIDTTTEWMTVITAVQALANVGDSPVGYWCVSMGTRQGVPLVATDQRIKAAVLGLFGLFTEGNIVKEGFEEKARSIEIPLIFVSQWHDELMKRGDGLKLYDAFGSKQKTMYINPGGHVAIPPSERSAWKAFFRHHLDKY